MEVMFRASCLLSFDQDGLPERFHVNLREESYRSYTHESIASLFFGFVVVFLKHEANGVIRIL